MAFFFKLFITKQNLLFVKRFSLLAADFFVFEGELDRIGLLVIGNWLLGGEMSQTQYTNTLIYQYTVLLPFPFHALRRSAICQ